MAGGHQSTIRDRVSVTTWNRTRTKAAWNFSIIRGRMIRRFSTGPWLTSPWGRMFMLKKNLDIQSKPDTMGIVKTCNNIKYDSYWVADAGNASGVFHDGLHTTQHQEPSPVKRWGFFISNPSGLSATVPGGGFKAVLRCRKTKKHPVCSEDTHNPRSSNSLLKCTLSDNDDGFPVGHGSGLATMRRLIKGGIVSWQVCLKMNQVLFYSFLPVAQ